MDTRTGRLAGCPQARQGGGPVEIGQDSPAEVVGRRRHGQPVPERVEPEVPDHGRERREASGEVVHGADVQPHVVNAVLAHAGGHGGRHHVAGLQLVHEALAPVIPQPGPFAAQGLAE